MGGLSWWHWLIIIGVFILLFGAKKLPDAARGLGRSLRILKSEVSAMHDDDPKEKVPTETDVTARQATPAGEILATPAVQVPPVVAPAVVQPSPVQQTQPVTQPVQQPAVNGVPVSEQHSS
jgi:sec-independent protein translocase protein TatA